MSTPTPDQRLPGSPWAARACLVLLLLSLSFGALGPVTARGQEPPTLDRRMVDETGELDADDTERIEAAFGQVEESSGVQVFGLLVGTTGDAPAPDYAEEVARTNGLGGNDALIVVALDDRRDAVWVGPSLDGIGDDEIDAALVDYIEPRLQEGDWAGAFVGGAQALGDAQRGSLGGGDALPGGSVLVAVLAIGAIGVGGWLVWRQIGQRRGAGEPAGPDGKRLRDIEDLAREANRLLVETDEDVRQNQLELGFAEAQFGTAETEPFRRVLAEARASLREAFALRQRLDDEEPEPDDERRRMLEEIIARCTKAESLMEEQREHFRTLRDLERDAPEHLSAMPESIAATEARLVEAEAQLERIEREAPGSARAVAGNITEARKRLSAARDFADDGRAALEQRDRSAAALSVRNAQETLAQSAALLDAIGRLASQLDEAREHGAPLRADVAADLAAARELLDQHPDPGLRGRVEAIEATLSAPAEADVLAEYRRLQEADSAANALVAAATEGAERRRREEAALRHALRNAEMRLDRAAAYIEGRRAGVGSVPRTRLREAEHELDRARELSDHEPQAALAAANRANTLAEQAYELARDDFGGYERRHGGAWGDPGSILLGAVLGGVLSGGGGRAGRRGGRSMGGGFGGVGRSRGGGFGGGGRSRGGAW